MSCERLRLRLFWSLRLPHRPHQPSRRTFRQQSYQAISVSLYTGQIPSRKHTTVISSTSRAVNRRAPLAQAQQALLLKRCTIYLARDFAVSGLARSTGMGSRSSDRLAGSEDRHGGSQLDHRRELEAASEKDLPTMTGCQPMLTLWAPKRICCRPSFFCRLRVLAQRFGWDPRSAGSALARNDRPMSAGMPARQRETARHERST